MNFRGDQRGRRNLVVEITSMIDVVFLLIIFFMATAQFAKKTRADIDLPKERGEQKEVAEEAGLVINITAEGTLIVNDEEMTMQQLDEKVNQLIALQPGRNARDIRLTIRADQQANTEILNRVISRLQNRGLGMAQFATEIPR